MQKTFTANFVDCDGKHNRITATAKITTTNHTYFAITGEIAYISRLHDPHTCGCIHDGIAKYFPQLRPLIKYHLCDESGTPMHYLANALYWYKEGNMKHFKSTCLYETVETDTQFDLSQPHTEEEVKQFLVERLPVLQAKFIKDVTEFFGSTDNSQ